MTKCSIGSCSNYVHARDMCNTHYLRFRKYGDPLKTKFVRQEQSTTICTVDNCNNQSTAKNLCQKHYFRQMKYGDVNHVARVKGENRSKNPVYKVYHAMLDRCKNPNNKYYGYYGGRGIQVCDRWQGIDGFSNFSQDMGERPSGLTLERVDNSKGYNPENCKWATHSVQQYNRRKPSNNTSGHIGISQYNNGKWTAAIYVKGKKKHLGYFDSKETAILAREEAINERN